MDDDILNADALQLARLNAQGMRDMRAASIKSLTDFTNLAAGDTALEITEYRRQLILALVAKYMTTSTATTQGAIDVDANNDAMRLKAAFEAVLKVQG